MPLLLLLVVLAKQEEYRGCQYAHAHAVNPPPDAPGRNSCC